MNYLIAFLLALVSASAMSQTPLKIFEVYVDEEQGLLDVTGRGFGATPSVRLAEQLLELVAADENSITAELPPLPPGNYRLRINRGVDVNVRSVDEFEVTLGAMGPEGPPGPQGKTGPQGPPGSSGGGRPHRTWVVPYFFDSQAVDVATWFQNPGNRNITVRCRLFSTNGQAMSTRDFTFGPGGLNGNSPCTFQIPGWGWLLIDASDPVLVRSVWINNERSMKSSNSVYPIDCDNYYEEYEFVCSRLAD